MEKSPKRNRKEIKFMKFLFVIGALLLLESSALAVRPMPSIKTHPSQHSTFTYDLGMATGSDNGNSYSEINIALNWYLTDWLNWRNAVFTRFGSNITSVSGLDSAFLATYESSTDDMSFGVRAFAGPGVRFATANNSAATAEAGVIFKLAGIQIGGGARYLSYFGSREDVAKTVLPKNETQYFIVLAGGGSF